jgi:hypothetical protein
MKEDILFHEEQYFNQWFIKTILYGQNILILLGLVTKAIVKKQDVFFTADILSWCIIFILSLGILFLFHKLHLTTQVTKEGISIKFFPFHLKPKFYEWGNIENCQIRKYSPILEYGGWGIRHGFRKSGIAYNVSGNMGLQLMVNNKGKILIGTQKPQELENTLTKMNLIKI